MTEFQSDWPLVPFLYTSLKKLVIDIMERFVLSSKVSLLVDLNNDENLLPVNKIKVGIAIKAELAKCEKASSLEIHAFKKQCRDAMTTLVKRMIDGAPLNLKISKYLTCLDPNISYTTIGSQRLESLLLYLRSIHLLVAKKLKKYRRSSKNCVQSLMLVVR